MDQFAKNKAEEEFEQTLEIIASLAVRLDKRGDAVGLLTNGAVVGDGPAGVPVTKSSSQLPAILEVLARLQMEPKRDSIGTLRRGLEMSWGMSCVYFSYEEGETVAVLKEYFRHHRTPVTFFVWRPCLTSREVKSGIWQKVHCLDDIRIKEAPREMKKGNGVPLFLINGGMELSWLYAWATFLTTLTFHQPFPFKEAIGPFVLASALTLFSKERGWWVIQILGLQLIGFILVGITDRLHFQRRVPFFLGQGMDYRILQQSSTSPGMVVSFAASPLCRDVLARRHDPGEEIHGLYHPLFPLRPGDRGLSSSLSDKIPAKGQRGDEARRIHVSTLVLSIFHIRSFGRWPGPESRACSKRVSPRLSKHWSHIELYGGGAPVWGGSGIVFFALPEGGG